MPNRSTLRWLVEIALLAIALFVVRIACYGDLVDVTPEACHTGGIAAELLDRGLRFRVREYTPELYENGIFAAGALAAPLFLALGRNVLALKILAHVSGVTIAACGLALLDRVLEGLAISGERPRRAARAAYVALTALAPPLMTLKMLDPLGDHNEGAALSMLLFVLLARRMEAPSRGRFAALWLAGGAAVLWEKGAALVLAFAFAYEILAFRRGKSTWQRLAVAPALFLVTYSPGLVTHFSTGFADAFTVASKFNASVAKLPGKLLIFGVLSGASIPLLAGFAASVVAWGIFARRHARFDSMIPYLGGYVIIHLLLVLRSRNEAGTYFIYGFPLWILALAVLAARLGDRLSARYPRAGAGAHAAVVILFAALSAHRLTFRPGRFAELLRDRDHAVCRWRFGRAFLLANHSDAVAVERCRSLGGDHALECISGLPYGTGAAAIDLLALPGERRAFAFGVGRASVQDSPRDECGALRDEAEHAACEEGRRWECFAYADLADRMMGQTPLGRPECSLEAASVGRFFERSVEDWKARPRRAVDPKRIGNGRCMPLFQACAGAP